MKKVIDGVLVVEGKSDVAFLSNYIDAEFVTTNGSDVPSSTIEYLKNKSKDTKIIVLTDPDFPGKKIRDTLDGEIPNLKHVFIEKSHAIKHHKVGVAEADIEHVLEALDHEWSESSQKGSITMSDLCALGLVGDKNANERREIIAKKYHLGFTNAKTFLKRINSLNISIEELEKDLNK